MVRTGVTTILLVGIALIAPLPTNAVEIESKERYLEVKGVKLRYLVQGKGEPVVLIHSLHANGELNWEVTGIMDRLAADHMLIVPDLPGHGKSGRPDQMEAYGVQMVEDMIALLDHLQIKKAHFVGYSLGGMITLKLISLHPDRALTGTLGGTGWLREGSRMQEAWANFPDRSEDMRAPIACVRSISTLALTEMAVREIQVPILVLVGSRDPVKRIYVTPLQAVRKDWQVVEVRGAKHMNCLVKYDFADELVTWLKKHRQ